MYIYLQSWDKIGTKLEQSWDTMATKRYIRTRKYETQDNMGNKLVTKQNYEQRWRPPLTVTEPVY